MRALWLLLILMWGCGQKTHSQKPDRSVEPQLDCLESRLELKARPAKSRKELIQRVLLSDMGDCQPNDAEIDRYQNELTILE